MHTKEGQARQKKKEQQVFRLLQRHFAYTPDIGDATPAPGCFVREKQIDFRCAAAWDGHHFARIDFVVNVDDVLVFLEVDEDQHRYGIAAVHGSSYNCDARRMMAVMASLTIESTAASAAGGGGGGGGGGRKVAWVRHNPDRFRVDGGIWRRRKAAESEALLLRVIAKEAARLRAADDEALSVTYINYDTAAGGKLAHLVDEDFPAELRIITRTPEA